MGNLPNIHSGWAVIQYLIVLLILFKGVQQFILLRRGKVQSVRSLVPLGALCTVIGFIAYFMEVKSAFKAIEIANDISPALVAGSISYAFTYPVLGLLGLGISFLFRYINQRSAS